MNQKLLAGFNIVDDAGDVVLFPLVEIDILLLLAGNGCALTMATQVGHNHRVAQLSDREDFSQRPNRLPFISIIPLKEILGEMMSVGPASKRVDAEYFSLIRRFGPELYLLLDMPMEDLRQAGKEHLAEAIQYRSLDREGWGG